jgi:tryptophan-rich sensory protein
MGYSSYLISSHSKTNPLVQDALNIYRLQLLLNWTWTPLFFTLKRPDLAAVNIIAMLVAIAVTGKRFYEIEPFAGLLFVPYFIWVSYASTINLYVWWFNPPAKVKPKTN